MTHRELLTDEEQQALAEVSQQDDAASASVLLVEDDDDFRELLAQLLEHSGIHCYTAAGPESALAALRRKRSIGMLVTDLRLDRADGLELVRSIRESERANLPVVIMSGRADVTDAIDAMHLNVVDFLLKPFEFARLESLVRRELLLEEAPLAS